MLHVVLDTTAYKEDPQRKRAGFQALGQLCQQGAIVLHIPSIVRREFISHLGHDLENVLEETVRSVRRLQRIDEPADSKARADHVAGELSQLAGTYARDVENRFDQWVGNIGALLHDVPADCLNEVLEQYFAGQGPFKKVKNREDFPDAFIWHTVRQIAADHKSYVVCADNNLRAAIAKLPDVDVFENLDALIESQIVQDLFPDNFIRRHSTEILGLFEDDQRFLERELLALLTAELTSSHISYRDDDSADITDVSRISTLEFDFLSARQYGSDVFRVPFEASVEITLDYFLLKTTYYEMPDWESQWIDIGDSDWNESYMHVTEQETLELTGVLAISLDARAIIAGRKDGALTWSDLQYNYQLSLDRLDRLRIQDNPY